MHLQTALTILKEKAGDLADERLLYSQCPEGFEFWTDRPSGYCGACFYKILENGEFFFWPSPGFGKGRSLEGWTEPKKIGVDFSADPPTWREV